MSKAFTREDGEEEAPLRAPPVTGPARPITPPGFHALTQTLQALDRELRSLRSSPSVEQDVALRATQAKRAHVCSVLEHVVPQLPVPDAEGRATFGAHVELADEHGAQMTYQLVGPDETDVRAGKVSVQSPLGAALLGRRAGEAVLLERPRGDLELTVKRVRYD